MTNARVVAFLGLPGAGKTYSAVHYLCAIRRKRPSATVYANIPLRLPGLKPSLPMETVDDWVNARNGVILLDEAHILLGSREWSQKERARVAAKLGQLRKDGIQLLYTTHTAEKVDVRLRELTEEVRYMTSVFGSGGPFWYDVRGGFARTEKRQGFGFVWRRGDVDAAYRTDMLVGSEGFGGADFGGASTPRPDVLQLLPLERARQAAGAYVVHGAGHATTTMSLAREVGLSNRQYPSEWPALLRRRAG